MNGISAFRFFLVIVLMFLSSLYIFSRYAVLAGEGGSGLPDWETGGVLSRGPIMDRNGRILAAEVRRHDISVRPPRDRNGHVDPRGAEALAVDLAPILGMEIGDVYGRIMGATGDFVIAKRVPVETVEAIRASQDRTNGRLPGVTPVPVPIRVYPGGDLAAQIVGFVGTEYEGLEGVEFAMNSTLSGKETGSRGGAVYLTIDANVQHILERISAEILEETEAEHVIFMATDPRSGDILGSAVVPGFDPNNHRAVDSSMYKNLAAMEHFEPGSVFKVFSIAALLESGAITPETEFFCNGTYERVFPGGEVVRISCAGGVAHGRVRAREIIALSCNVGAASAAERYPAALFHEALSSFGFGKRTGAWVNRETPGILANPAVWSGRSRQSIAFGQEIAVSALQIVQAASVIANGGLLVPPRIIREVVPATGRPASARSGGADGARRVISPETARTVLGYMRDTASFQGTGWRADMRDLNLAVKTGTSQILDARGGYLASTLAMLPAENPSLVLYVAISRPQGEIFGARIAAPAIRRAAEEIVDYLGIPRGRNPVFHHAGDLNILPEVLPPVVSTVPNFAGLSKRTLLPLLSRDDIRVEIWGDGWVRSQFPPPGVAVTKGMVIELDLQ